MNITIGKEYIGKIVSGIDSKQQGGYLVHIPEILPHLAESGGIYCKNGVHTWRLTQSDSGVYGSYFPLHPGTKVAVQFSDTDLNSGRIVKIISDDSAKSDLDIKSGSAKSSAEDRDEQYIIIATPKKKNSIFINENSSSDSNSMFIIFNGLRSAIKISEDGIHISTDDNFKQKIVVNREIEIDGSSSITVNGGNYDIYVNGDTNILSTGNVNVDGATVNLNSGMAAPAKKAVEKIS